MEILIYYVVPNVALFGSIYLFAKLLEKFNWYVISNYERLIDSLKQK